MLQGSLTPVPVVGIGADGVYVRWPMAAMPGSKSAETLACYQRDESAVLACVRRSRS